MILTNLSKSQLIAHLQMYNILLKRAIDANRKNIIDFRDQCINELNRRTDNV